MGDARAKKSEPLSCARVSFVVQVRPHAAAGVGADDVEVSEQRRGEVAVLALLRAQEGDNCLLRLQLGLPVRVGGPLWSRLGDGERLRSCARRTRTSGRAHALASSRSRSESAHSATARATTARARAMTARARAMTARARDDDGEGDESAWGCGVFLALTAERGAR